MSRNCWLAAFAAAALFTLPALAEEDKSKPDAEEMVYRVSLGRADDVRLLITQGIGPDTVNDSGVPVLALAAARIDDEGVNVVKALLDLGASIDARDTTGQTALFYAARKGSKKNVELLLERGASYYLKDNNGNIARNVAYTEGHKDLAEAMDNFVKKQTADVQAKYEEYNRLMTERARQEAEAAKAAEDEQNAAQAKAIEDAAIAAMTEEEAKTAEKEARAKADAEAAKAAEAAKPKIDQEALRKITQELAFHNCAFQYWSFCQSTGQSTEMASEELSVAIDSHKEKVMQLIQEMVDHYQSNRQFTDKVSYRAKEHIFNRLAIMPSKTYRHGQGVGKMEDMTTRCTEIARHWSDDPPPLPDKLKKKQTPASRAMKRAVR